MAHGGPTRDMETGIHKEMHGKLGMSYAGQESQNEMDPELHAAKAKHSKVLEEMKSMPKPDLMAEGGEASLDPQENQDEGTLSKIKGDLGYAEGGEVDPMIHKIMMGRSKGYSEGGKVANDTEMEAGFMPNDFDDLALRDDLEGGYTGENSGDELGNEQEDMDREDIISRLMRSRAKKDRMPRPA